MTPSSFADRFGYALWLRHLADGAAPGWAAIGRAVERTGQAVSAWSSLAQAPVDYRVHEPLAAFLGVREDWLVKGTGEAPRHDLWAIWSRERRIDSMSTSTTRKADEADIVSRGGGGSFRPHKTLEELQSTKKPAAKTAGRRKAGGKGGR